MVNACWCSSFPPGIQSGIPCLGNSPTHCQERSFHIGYHNYDCSPKAWPHTHLSDDWRSKLTINISHHLIAFLFSNILRTWEFVLIELHYFINTLQSKSLEWLLCLLQLCSIWTITFHQVISVMRNNSLKMETGMYLFS